MVAETVEGAKKGFLKWIIAGVVIILAFAGTGLFQIHRSVENYAIDCINNRIAAQFSVPHIQQTLREVAMTRANEIIEQELRRPAIDKAQEHIAQSLQPLQDSMANAKEQLASVSDELQRERYRMLLCRQVTVVGPPHEAIGTMALFCTHPHHR